MIIIQIVYDAPKGQLNITTENSEKLLYTKKIEAQTKDDVLKAFAKALKSEKLPIFAATLTCFSEKE